MIKQTDKRLNAKIQVFGCWVMAHARMISAEWTPAEVEALYEAALKAGFIDENCTGLKVQEFLALAAQIKKVTPIRQRGGLDHEQKDPNKKAWGANMGSLGIKFVVVKWSTQSKHFHFTLHTPKGEIYDPFDPTDANYTLHKMQRVSEQYYG